MGNYCAKSFNLKFKQHTPTQIIEVLKSLANIDQPDDFDPDRIAMESAHPRLVSELQSSMNGGSAYFKEWDNIRSLEKDEDGCYIFKTKTSSKLSTLLSVKTYLEYILPVLVVEEGTLLYRHVYEDAWNEFILYHSEGKIIQALGYWYDMDINNYDHEHPSHGGVGDLDHIKTYTELMTVVEEKKKRSYENNSYFGF